MQFPAWDPVLVEIPGLPIDIRWYGLMYVVGFAAGYQILLRLARSRFLPMDPDKVGDLIFYLVFGVLLGGRVGYALFYDQALLNPLELVQMWKGGLAFHGGLLGVIVALILFSRRHGLPAMRVADSLCLAGFVGVFAVRMANFINGELYGRVTSATTFLAMQFPTDEAAERLMGIQGLGLDMRSRELVIQVAFGHRTWDSIADQLPPDRPWDMVRAAVEGDGTRTGWEILSSQLDAAGEPLIPHRHPSQLYEGLSEGLLVGLLLWGVYFATRKRPLGRGAFTGLFMLGYAAARFCCEFVRQPDAQFRDETDPVGTVFLGLTMGQTLSLGMVVGGVYCLWYSRRQRASASDSQGAAASGVASS